MSDEKFEIKTHLSALEHDDALLCCRSLGFKNRAEWVRYLIRRELYGVHGLVEINQIPGALRGLKTGESGRDD